MSEPCKNCGTPVRPMFRPALGETATPWEVPTVKWGDAPAETLHKHTADRCREARRQRETR